jgi:CBS domain-containing protein
MQVKTTDRLRNNKNEEAKEFLHKRVKSAFRLIVGHAKKVKATAKVYEVVDKLLEDVKTRTVYVVDDENKLIGKITLHDLIKVICAKCGVADTELIPMLEIVLYGFSKNAVDLMKPPITITQEERLVDALRKMEDNDIDDLAVIDEHGKLIGELNGTEILLYSQRLFRTEVQRAQ